ncbi:hypothetical protein U1Q18_039179, partial [Sarracenia purpurea var. burkii]
FSHSAEEKKASEGHVVDRCGDRRRAQIRIGVKSIRVLQLFAGKEEIDEVDRRKPQRFFGVARSLFLEDFA